MQIVFCNLTKQQYIITVMKCIAVTRAGSQCKNQAKDGDTFCGIHLLSDNDIAPFAESLPDNLVNDFVASSSWKRILSNRADLQYLESAKAEKLRQSGGGRDFFNELNEAWREVELCESASDTQGREVALRNVGELIKRGKRSEKYKAEILDIIERSRRLRESEVNSETKVGALIPLAQVLLEMRQYVALVLAAARRVMPNDDYLRLSGELVAIQNNPPLLESITRNITIDL